MGVFLLLRGEPEVDEEGGGAAIVADEVAEEDVGEVGIEFEHGYTDRWYSIDYQIAGVGWGSYCLFVLRHREAEMIRGVKIASIPVRDQDVSLKFYTEKLGFKVATDQEMGPGQRWIELMIPGSDVNVALFKPNGNESRVVRIGGFQPVTFWTDDVFATAEQMKKKGVVLTAEPRKEVWGTMAIFKDPDGNEFVFSSR